MRTADLAFCATMLCRVDGGILLTAAHREAAAALLPALLRRCTAVFAVVPCKALLEISVIAVVCGSRM